MESSNQIELPLVDKPTWSSLVVTQGLYTIPNLGGMASLTTSLQLWPMKSLYSSIVVVVVFEKGPPAECSRYLIDVDTGRQKIVKGDYEKS